MKRRRTSLARRDSILTSKTKQTDFKDPHYLSFQQSTVGLQNRQNGQDLGQSETTENDDPFGATASSPPITLNKAAHHVNFVMC